MNIALVDDNEADRLRLERTLRQYDGIHGLGLQIQSFPNGEALLRSYQPFQYTVIFLDIYMDGMSGIETARQIREKDADAILVFLTTSDSHRPDAFSLFASAYLSKPSSEEEVFRALDHILRLHTEKDKRFSFSYNRQSYSLRFADIVSMETDGNYLDIRDREGKAYRTRMTFSRAQAQMDARFLTLMKGILVNMDYIEQIKDTVCRMQGGSTFPLQVKNERELKQTWLNYKFAAIRDTTWSDGGGD